MGRVARRKTRTSVSVAGPRPQASDSGASGSSAGLRTMTRFLPTGAGAEPQDRQPSGDRRPDSPPLLDRAFAMPDDPIWRSHWRPGSGGSLPCRWVVMDWR